MSNCSHYILLELWFVRRNNSLDLALWKLQSLHLTWIQVCFVSTKSSEQVQSLPFSRPLVCETQQFSRLGSVKCCRQFTLLEPWFVRFDQVRWATAVTIFYLNLICEMLQFSRLSLVANRCHQIHLNPDLFVSTKFCERCSHYTLLETKFVSSTVSLSSFWERQLSLLFARTWFDSPDNFLA